jgi:aspartate-semialdehyde dehydrogenase
MAKKSVNVIVAGATGAVGRTMVKVLEERNFPVGKIRLLCSARSAGSTMKFRGKDVVVEEITEQAFKGFQVALFSMPKGASRRLAPIAAKDGCVVVDNSNDWRMDADVPLVVPEVNPHDIAKHKGIIANPNCSTIQMVVALKPLADAAGLRRVIVSTYQAVSGVSLAAMDELRREAREALDGKKPQVDIFPVQIAFNCIPQIPQSHAFGDNGYTSEEMKLVNETRKIMGIPDLLVSPTTVRVPVVNCHGECVNAEFKRKITADEAREHLRKAPGIVVMDDPAKQLWPTPLVADGRDEVFVGRIRQDLTTEYGINLWIVSDNLRKGAATNAVQIAELLI